MKTFFLVGYIETCLVSVREYTECITLLKYTDRGLLKKLFV